MQIYKLFGSLQYKVVENFTLFIIFFVIRENFRAIPYNIKRANPRLRIGTLWEGAV